MQLLTRFATVLVALVLVDSTRAAESRQIPLKAGAMSMVFDADNVLLRYIRVGDHEILRGINAPVRDANWATVAPQVSDLRVESQSDGFDVTFNVTCQQSDIDFRWKGRITGRSNGEVEFTFDGKAYSSFKKNRIGFCVLHGPSAAGQTWLLETVDGKKHSGKFPKFISPHQPAKNLRAITHDVAPGIQARVAFEGDTFEMEDQRNWTDASFKTYCTPLEIPYPVQLEKGTTISQKITIQIRGDLPNSKDVSPSGSTVLTLGKETSPLPRIGLQVSSEVAKLTEEQLDRLRELQLDHLRVDLALSDEAFVGEFRRATRQAKALGVSLQVVLGLGEAPALPKLLSEVQKLQPPVSYWLVRGGQATDFDAVRQQLSSVTRDAKIGVTRATNFVELNRARPEDDSIQAVGFAINPQIHAFDNASIVETLPIHADAVTSAKQFSGDRPMVIGPITMAPQLLDGIDQPGGPSPGALPTYVDPRQVEPFTAVWTLGSLKHLTDAGADSATYFETVGWNGVMDADAGAESSRPAEFPSRPGETYPVYDLLREVSEFRNGRVYQLRTSNDLSAVGMTLRIPGRMRTFVGNLTGETQQITLRGLSGKPVKAQLLGGAISQIPPELSVTVPAYGIVRIDQVVD